MMKLSKHPILPLLINVSVGFFFVSVLAVKGGHNLAPVLLMALGLGYTVYALIKKQAFHLSAADKWLIYGYLCYFSVFVLSLLISGGKGRELDTPSRVVLLIPALLLLLRFPFKFSVLPFAVPLGAAIAGGVAIYDRFVLGSPMAFSTRTMHIQGGDIAMSLGMFSLCVALYFAQQTRRKSAALCLIAALLGMLGSFLSTARGGWVGLPVVLGVIFWIYRHTLSKRFFIGITVLVILAVTAITQLPNSRVMERFNHAKQDIQLYFDKNNGYTSLGARFDMWKSAWLMAKEKPLLGWGTQGATAQRKAHADAKIISKMAGTFDHAHNQYLDDLSKRGVIGLVALLGILLIPLRQFVSALRQADGNSPNAPAIRLTATLGIVHVVSVMLYGLSQGFFTHNSGSIFYFFLTVVFYAALRQLTGNTAATPTA